MARLARRGRTECFHRPLGASTARLRLLGMLGGLGLLSLLVLLGASLVSGPAPENPHWTRSAEIGPTDDDSDSSDRSRSGNGKDREQSRSDGAESDDSGNTGSR